MKYYYNSYRINWADEANFYGFELISETEIQRRKEICRLAAELGEDCGYRIGRKLPASLRRSDRPVF